MKSGMPWSLRGVDDETREAIHTAARRAGLTVSEWLNNTVGEPESEAADADNDHPSAIAAALHRLTARLRAMDDRSRATVPNLIRRLDEIEQRLAVQAETGRTDGSLKGVSAMVEKLARDIEDADERARTMIEGQRAAGPMAPAVDVTRVTEAIRDLDRRIARMGERPQPQRQDSAPALDDIGSRLTALLAERPKTRASVAGERAATIDAALRGLEARIDEAKARLIQPRETASAESDQIARIERRLSDIGNRLAGRDRAAPPSARAAEAARTDKGNDLAAAIAEISARQRTLDERSESASMRREHTSLSATMEMLRSDLAGLSAQVAALNQPDTHDQTASSDLVRRIEALSAEMPVDRSLLTAIRSDLASLRGTVERNAAGPSLEQIEARTEAISTRLEDLARKTPDRTRLDALGEEVSALRRALEADDSPRAIQRLEMRVAELGRSVEAAIGRKEPSVNPALERLEGQLTTLGEELKVALANRNAAAASQEAVERLEHRLDSLSKNIVATLSERSEPSILGRLDEIGARIDDLLDRAPAVASIATMHARLQSLVESVEGLSASQHEPAAALDEIKSEIAAIRRDIAGRGAPDTDHLEQQIRDLAARLEAATNADSEGAGMAELEAQVARLASQLEDDSPRAAVLRHVEESLETLQSRLSESHRESIEAARVEARAAVNELSASLDDRGINTDLIRALRQDLDNLRAATDDHPAHGDAEPTAVDQTLTQVVDRLDQLEQVTAAETRATGTHGIGAAAAAAQKSATGDRRADFIAAARRAAQAAAAEAHRIDAPASEAAGAEATHKPGAFARISQAIRSRKRPLLLAAAAIVLAIGAVKLYGTVNSGTETHLIGPEPTASVEAPKSAIDDVLAAAGAVAPAGGGNSAAMVAPSATPDSSVAFSAPEVFDSRFGGGNAAPATSAFASAAPAAASAPPAAAAAPALPVSQTTGAAPDAAIGSPKLVKAAASGDAAAAFEVAARYAAGDHVSKDLAKAAEWYQHAAEGGVAVAQYRLGSLYERGQGVTKDLTKAVDWYQRAADQGNVNAMHNLAVLMSEGVDGQPDQEKALQWFLAAADYGVRDSQYNLGVIYARGLGTPQDLGASYKWFAIAAAQGDSDAAQRRDEVAKLLTGNDLAKARAAVTAWHAKPPLADANGVSVPEGGWDSPGNTLGDADRAALVKKIQTLLADQGFDPGPADGVAGSRTRDAVKAYQRQNGIAQTGQIDGSLVAALTDQNI
jgi:localization factor PodJL